VSAGRRLGRNCLRFEDSSRSLADVHVHLPPFRPDRVIDELRACGYAVIDRDAGAEIGRLYRRHRGRRRQSPHRPLCRREEFVERELQSGPELNHPAANLLLDLRVGQGTPPSKPAAQLGWHVLKYRRSRPKLRPVRRPCTRDPPAGVLAGAPRWGDEPCCPVRRPPRFYNPTWLTIMHSRLAQRADLQCCPSRRRILCTNPWLRDRRRPRPEHGDD